MTLRTITFDDSTHKLVPREATEKQLDVAVSHALMVSITSSYKWTQYMSDVWSRMIESAPEYQEPDVKILFAWFIPACGMFTRSKDERDKWVDKGHEVLPLYVIPEQYPNIEKDK